jgi:hypothetical protein
MMDPHYEAAQANAEAQARAEARALAEARAHAEAQALAQAQYAAAYQMPMTYAQMNPHYAAAQAQALAQAQYAAAHQTPMSFAQAQPIRYDSMQPLGTPRPMHMQSAGYGTAPARYDHPNLPGYAWTSYSPYPNYGSLTYPKQYSPTAWPYIGPFYPYPQVPLGWRKVSLEWDDGWWMLDFSSK